MCVKICLIRNYQSLKHYHCWVACWENDKYLLAHDTMRRKQIPIGMSLYKHGTAWHHSLQNFYKASYMFTIQKLYMHLRNTTLFCTYIFYDSFTTCDDILRIFIFHHHPLNTLFYQWDWWAHERGQSWSLLKWNLQI